MTEPYNINDFDRREKAYEEAHAEYRHGRQKKYDYDDYERELAEYLWKNNRTEYHYHYGPNDWVDPNSNK